MWGPVGVASYSGATWRPGPRSKTGYDGYPSNSCRGVVLHSMVGSLTAAMARLDSPDRASWHFSIDQDGRIYQHYDSSAVTWHAGSLAYNTKLIGVEHAGGPVGNESEPLTPPQLASSLALTRWLSTTHGFPLERRVGLWEHGEIYSTACPSNRIPWLAYKQEEDMKPFLAWCPERQMTYFVGPNGCRWITQQAVVDELARTFGPLSKTLSAAAIDAIGIARP